MKPLKNSSWKLICVFLPAIILVTSCKKDPIDPVDNSSTIPKLDTLINVDVSEAIVNYNDSLSIRIPQGAVNGDTKLTITKLDDSAIPEDEEMEFPDVYEVTLGDQHVFNEPLEITLKFEPNNLYEGKLKYKIGAGYYNEDLERWSLFQDVYIDTLQNTVLIKTNHLTKLSWYHLKYAYGYTDYMTSPHFIIYWTDGKVPKDTEYNSSLSNHQGSAPHYIQDILIYLEEAREVYEDQKLTVPNDTTDKVEVRVLELDPGEDGNTSYFGFIRISQDIEKNNTFSQEELVQITCAHELLHYVQDYYYMWTFAGNTIKWWLEATAVQADRMVWPNKSNFEAVNYADESLGVVLGQSWDNCNSDPNYYIAGGFLTYLTTYREGAKLSIPEIIIETGKATNLSYFRTILNDHLKNKLSSSGIGFEYRDYATWAFEHQGPIKIKYLPPLSNSNSSYVVPVRLTKNEPSWQGSVTVQNLAIKMVKIISPESQGSSKFRIICNSQDAQIDQHIYITDNSKTNYKKYLIAKDTVKVVLENKGQWIDILSTNIMKDESGSFDLSVELVQGPAITNISPSTAKVGETVQIKGSNFGSSPGNSEIWFGAVKALYSDIVSWLDNQIDVKVPEGAETGDVNIMVDGEKSNDVNFTVIGAPIITDVIDHYYHRNHQAIRRFSLPKDELEIIGKFFGDYPSLRKVYIDDIEVQVNEWRDTLVRAMLPEGPTGNITVKLVSSNGESNEFPYFIGLPASHLNTAESIRLNAGFWVEFFNAKANRNSSHYVGTRVFTFSPEHYSWSGRVLTVDLDIIENITGTAIYTFSEDGLNLERVEVDYSRSTMWPKEIVHFTGSNFPMIKDLDFNGYYYYEYRTCGDDLEQSTTSISGSINYVDDLRADFDGVDYSKDCAWNDIYLQLIIPN